MDTTVLIALIATVILIIYLVYTCEKPKEEKKEGFFNAAGGAFLDSNSPGVVKGNLIFSDGMMLKNQYDNFEKDIKNDMYYATQADFGAVKNNKNFNTLMANQNAIQSINNKNNGAVMSQSDMKSINQKILSSANNSKFNLFDRAGDRNVKLHIDPSGTRAVIDADYLGDRDKNYSIDVVRRVIKVPTFDMSIDRIPQQMTGPSGILGSNKKSKPIDSAASLKEGTATHIVDNENGNLESFRTARGYMVHGNANN